VFVVKIDYVIQFVKKEILEILEDIFVETVRKNGWGLKMAIINKLIDGKIISCCDCCGKEIKGFLHFCNKTPRAFVEDGD